MEKTKLVFEEITVESSFADYTAECSGERSDCCTRVCSNNRECAMTEEAWGKFLEINGGIIQY
jgi:hypothetical protein